GEGGRASPPRGVRIPPRQPVIARLEGIASIGVVLHLDDIKDDAKLSLDPRPDSDDKKATVALKDVLTGKPVALWDGAARVRLVTTATRITDGKTEDDFPAACYGPDGTLWVAYVAYTLKEEGRRIEAAPLKEQPADFENFYTPEFGDQLFVRYYRSGKWSKPFAVTGAKEDFVRCAIAAEKSGDAWVVYSANHGGNYNIYTRKLDLKSAEAGDHPKPRIGPEQRLTKDTMPNLAPVACTDQGGSIRVLYQTWGHG